MAINNLMNAAIQPSGINVYDSIWGCGANCVYSPIKRFVSNREDSTESLGFRLISKHNLLKVENL